MLWPPLQPGVLLTWPRFVFIIFYFIVFKVIHAVILSDSHGTIKA